MIIQQIKRCEQQQQTSVIPSGVRFFFPRMYVIFD